MTDNLPRELEEVVSGEIASSWMGSVYDDQRGWLSAAAFARHVLRRAGVPGMVEERERLRRWVNDLQSGMYVNCVYCGHQYGPGETTPVSMADALKAHVEQCPDHPMSALREERDALREAHDLAIYWLRGYERDDEYATHAKRVLENAALSRKPKESS